MQKWTLKMRPSFIAKFHKCSYGRRTGIDFDEDGNKREANFKKQINISCSALAAASVAETAPVD